MNLSFYIAKRYLFSKKSHNAINVISMISVCGIIVATIALVCTLSVFNGFTRLVSDTFSAFDPDLEITPIEGKVFPATDSLLFELQKVPNVELISQNLEENALLKFESRQEPILLKGVSNNFNQLANFDKLIIDGDYMLRDGDVDYAQIGAGLAVLMSSRPGYIAPLEIYIPKRNEKINLANPASAFTHSDVFAAGVFALNQAEYDNQILIVSIELIRELLRYENEVTSLNIKVKDGASLNKVKQQIKEIVGNEFLVKNRFEQQETLYQWVNVEKWITFLILAIVSLIAIFNVVGSLSMLIIDKTADIQILQSLGANYKLIGRIFLLEGWLITFFGGIFGLIFGLTICLIQEHFGVLTMGTTPGTYAIDAYPVAVEFWDVLVIFLTVSIFGALAVIYPVNYLMKNLKKSNSL